MEKKGLKIRVVTGLIVICMGLYSVSAMIVCAGEAEILLKNNSTSSGFTIKEETFNSTIARFRGDGNVGIGIANPIEKLEVNGNVKISGAGNGIKFVDGTTQTTAATGVGGGGSGDGHSLDAVDGNPTDAVFVDNNGNVGIGITSPDAKLHVTGDIALISDGLIHNWSGVPVFSHKNFLFGFGQNSSGNTFIHAGDVASGNIFFRTGTNLNRMTIGSSGNVGIGDTNPDSILHLRKDAFGALGTTLTLINGAGPAFANAVAIDMNVNPSANPSSSQILAVDEGGFSSSIRFLNKIPGVATNSLAERMRITTSGNVGIGLTNPTATLDVAGNINASGAVTQGSSRGIKDNILPISIEQAMTAFKHLEPVSFVYKNDSSKEERLGFIAEDVPAFVATQGRKHLNTMDLTAVMTKVVQEQQKMLLDQKETIEKMAKRIRMLEVALDSGHKGL